MIAVAVVLAAQSFAANDEPTLLDPFTVKADRVEDFGFDLSISGPPEKADSPAWRVRFVVPHTAAAKAGLKAGDRVLKLDGQPVAFRAWREWARVRKQKRDGVAAGGSVTWSLEVEAAETKQTRTLTLTIPTSPPHWAGPTWSAPEGRVAARVPESGPLAELARTVLDNGVETQFGWPFLQTRNAAEANSANSRPLLGYTWTIFDEASRPHKITVSQSRGRTDIVLAAGKSGSGIEYLTSPSGALDEAVAWPGRKSLAAQKAASGFQQEVEFWTQKVGRVSPRWPLELRPDEPAPKKRS